MARVTKHRMGPKQNFDLTKPDGLCDTFSDGVAEIQLGATHIKVSLFQILGTTEEDGLEEPVEQRQVVSVLTMNLATFIESFGNVLATIGQNQQLILATAQGAQEQLTTLLAKLNGVQPMSSPRSHSKPKGAGESGKPISGSRPSLRRTR